VFEVDGATLIVLADGAGGIGGGELAASMVVDAFRGASAFDVAANLESLDARVAADRRAGETTAVVVAMMGETLWGGSAGDSEAWLFHARDHQVEQELTRRQGRKRIGSGCARVQSFSTSGGDEPNERLLIASDGLFKYAPYAMIRDTARIKGLDAAADALLECARLATGRFCDDVSLFLGEWP
jgi:serine/threonine protein phosphatase PrpC